MFDFIPDHIYLFVFGLILLIKGGDWFVDGASSIAKRFKLPELLIGATVVSIGTTLPEVMTSATSALTGHGEIAYGNAIGSIICNTALIAAITIAVKPGKVNRKTLIFPTCFFFCVAIFYSLVAYIGGEFTRPIGIILLAAFVAYMVINVLNMKKNPEEDPEIVEISEEESDGSMIKDIFWLIVGALVIAVGADLLVESSTIIAKDFGMSESVIALTVVALGTSLPELVTAITALSKGHGALSLGNVIGANVFNLVLVSGVSVVLSPFTVPLTSSLFGANTSLVLDIPVMLGVMALMTVPAIIKNKLSRWQGITLLAIYVAFLVMQFLFVQPVAA
jgi:cation:H+ antiporter